MIRVLLAFAAIGLMSLSAFAQSASGQTPAEATRNATAQRVIDGQKLCTGCDLFQVDLSYKDLPGRDFSGSRLRQSDLSLATFDRAKFAGANLSIVNAFGARFEDADLAGANFSDATLVGAWFGGANLSSANLSNANLSGAYLRTAKGLTQGQISTACGDASTELPNGFTLRTCTTAGVATLVKSAPIEAAPFEAVAETARVAQPRVEEVVIETQPGVRILTLPATERTPVFEESGDLDGAPTHAARG